MLPCNVRKDAVTFAKGLLSLRKNGQESNNFSKRLLKNFVCCSLFLSFIFFLGCVYSLGVGGGGLYSENCVCILFCHCMQMFHLVVDLKISFTHVHTDMNHMIHYCRCL